MSAFGGKAAACLRHKARLLGCENFTHNLRRVSAVSSQAFLGVPLPQSRFQCKSPRGDQTNNERIKNKIVMFDFVRSNLDNVVQFIC
jgi:hypothetical protein